MTTRCPLCPLLAVALALAGCTHAPPPVPIACRMDALSRDDRARSQALRAELAAAVTGASELPQGYVFRMRPDPTLFPKVAEWITLERRCCPFLSFELAWSGQDAATPSLALTGPDGTKAFLQAELPELRTGG